MEKYGVFQDKDSTKIATDKKHVCPLCGVEATQLDNGYSVLLWCPEHGTEGWEKQKKQDIKDKK